jgi:hypothetical protein
MGSVTRLNVFSMRAFAKAFPDGQITKQLVSQMRQLAHGHPFHPYAAFLQNAPVIGVSPFPRRSPFQGCTLRWYASPCWGGEWVFDRHSIPLAEGAPAYKPRVPFPGGVAMSAGFPALRWGDAYPPRGIHPHTGKLVNVKSAGEKGVISGNYAFNEKDILNSKIRPALNKVAAPEFTGICSADIYPIRPADGNMLWGYLFYLLLSQDFLDYVIRNSERGKIPKINRDALLTYKVLIPLPAEQQRIASSLTTLDALITAKTQKLSTLKTHKKGLMQQLFPSPEDNTNP